jgi:hypothetical protein
MTDRPLREALLVDGGLTAVTGIAVLPFSGVLADPLGLPTAALVAGAVFCVLWGAALLVAGTRRVLSRRFATVVVDVNALAAVACAVIAVVAGLTTAGVVVFGALAVAIAVIATVQWRALAQPGKPAKIEATS